MASVVLYYGFKPADLKEMQQENLFGPKDDPVPELRVDYGVPSKALPHVYFAEFKSIPDDSCLYEVIHGTMTVASGIERWEMRGGLSRIRVEGRELPPTEDGTRRLIAFVRTL